ncbi:MAG: hypothetical protein H6711_08860 [Myxococcales bacterium]|nr:hypothetical protein [Myxococcales bacterium]
MYRPRDRSDELSPEQRQRLGAGRHEAVAAELRAAGRDAAAGWVLEQIWDFEGALSAYLAAGLGLDALRVALEIRNPAGLERALQIVEVAPEPDRREAIAILRRRGRHLDVARLLERDAEGVDARAEALRRGGDRLAAADALAKAGRIADALAALGLEGGEASGEVEAHALAARLCWELGDAESSVRHAQRALRGGLGPDRAAALQRLLGRALASLGHDLAAQIALGSVDHEGHAESAMPGRYHVRRTLPPTLAGSAYEGIDRVTLQEVEIHLLLADFQEGAVGPEVRTAIERFARRAEAAARLSHPAIRGLVRFDADAGLVVLPHAEGPPLRTLIHPPGISPTRARGLCAFLLEGLEVAHARGMVHGAILPSQLVCDAAGRPLLGPFGGDALAGLTATRTGSLEELLTIVAPECRLGAPASLASDIYSVGAIFAALLRGGVDGDMEGIGEREEAIIRAATADDPSARPDARALLGMLRIRAADARELRDEGGPGGPLGDAEDDLIAGAGLLVAAAASWPDRLVDELAAVDHPWIQPILDRDGRRLVLAPWPTGASRGLPGPAPFGELSGLSEELQAAIRGRARPSSWVISAGGACLLALDDLLER